MFEVKRNGVIYFLLSFQIFVITMGMNHVYTMIFRYVVDFQKIAK